ncbi:MAG: HK97 gp10 family phage protein [Firmicutes bacterium]|jgi:hypothetical protein|nr:HK97 gp10 family phage protein [Bacillota bacterium]
MPTVNFDMGELKQFFQNMENVARGDFKRDFIIWLEAIGFDFLRVVQNEIKNRKVIDSRLLLDSFTRNDNGNVWELSDGGLTLEVGTNVNYANYVEKGHWTNPKGTAQRFVPGHWKDGKFEYDSSAKSGMVLKQKWVDGKHYFESALRIYESIFKESAEIKLQQWMDKYFTF